MKTVLLPAHDPEAVERAARLLADGQTVALPTETVYGLAADARRADAAAAIFQAKERPFFDPLIVHLPGYKWLNRLAKLPAKQRDLVEQLTAYYWPGPLTLLLPRREKIVPDLVTAGSPLVALRMSAHPVFQAVAERFGGPLAAPSANRFGRISPTSGRHVLEELGGRIPLILDDGPTMHGLESTIVSIDDKSNGINVLRNGPITLEMLAGLDFVEWVKDAVGEKATSGKGVVPGQLPGHYAPRTPLYLLPTVDLLPEEWLLRSSTEKTVGVLGFRRDRAKPVSYCDAMEYLSESGDMREAAENLFAALRRLDASGVQMIVAEPVPETGLGAAIMERLRRAAAGSGGHCIQMPG